MCAQCWTNFSHLDRSLSDSVWLFRYTCWCWSVGLAIWSLAHTLVAGCRRCPVFSLSPMPVSMHLLHTAEPSLEWLEKDAFCCCGAHSTARPCKSHQTSESLWWQCPAAKVVGVCIGSFNHCQPGSVLKSPTSMCSVFHTYRALSTNVHWHIRNPKCS